jgi:hypothetical protein
MFRVDYFAERFGYVGWECFNQKDENIIAPCVQIACSQMSKILEESVWFKLTKL